MKYCFNNIARIIILVSPVWLLFSSYWFLKNMVKSQEPFCVFCDVIKGEKNLLHQDDELIALADIKPVSKFHILVIPKRHINNAKELTIDDQALLQNMIDTSKMVLKNMGADMDDTRFGFHWPPFNSISHLHLHAISPASEMSLTSKILFKPGTWWFVTPEYVMERIMKK